MAPTHSSDSKTTPRKDAASLVQINLTLNGKYFRVYLTPNDPNDPTNHGAIFIARKTEALARTLIMALGKKHAVFHLMGGFIPGVLVKPIHINPVLGTRVFRLPILQYEDQIAPDGYVIVKHMPGPGFIRELSFHKLSSSILGNHTPSLVYADPTHCTIAMKDAGKDLYDCIVATEDKSNPYMLTVDDKVRFTWIFIQLIQEIHRRGFVHGDLKAENVCIQGRDKVTLIDWGMAHKTSLRRSNYGTLAYCAPECFPLSDATHDPVGLEIWALGVVLFIMWMHTLPFDVRNPAAMDAFNAHGDLTVIIKETTGLELEWEKIPRKVRRIIWMLLDGNPSRRVKHFNSIKFV